MGDPVTLVLISTVAHNVYETQNTFIALASYATGPSAIDDDSIKAPWDDPFMVLMFWLDVDGIHYSGSKNCPNVWLFCKDWSRTNQKN